MKFVQEIPLISNNKENLVKFLDLITYFFFLALMILIPMAPAGVEISIVFIASAFAIKYVFGFGDLKDIISLFKKRINIVVLVFYICIGFSLFASGPFFDKSFTAWLFKWGEGLILFVIAQTFLDARKVRILIGIFLTTAFLICIDGIYQHIYGVDFIRGYKLIIVPSFQAVRACFKHYNGFATYLLTVYFITLGWISHLKSTKFKIVFMLLTPLALYNLFTTYSRGAWTAFLFTFLLLIWISCFCFKQKYFIHLLPAIFIVLVIVAIRIFNDPCLRNRILNIFNLAADSKRFLIWKAGFDMFLKAPFIGHGVGTFMDRLAESTKLGYRYAHNCYLQILVETGILGFWPFMWFLIELVIAAYKSLERNFNRLLLGLCLGFFAFLVHSFFDIHFYSLKLSILAWILSSFILITSNNTKLVQSPDSKVFLHISVSKAHSKPERIP